MGKYFRSVIEWLARNTNMHLEHKQEQIKSSSGLDQVVVDDSIRWHYFVSQVNQLGGNADYLVRGGKHDLPIELKRPAVLANDFGLKAEAAQEILAGKKELNLEDLQRLCVPSRCVAEHDLDVLPVTVVLCNVSIRV